MSISSIQYENRIVLFLDILGFKSIIDKTIEHGKDRVERIEKLHETLHLVKVEVSRINKGTSKVITQFSDSIVVSFEENDTEEITYFFGTILSLVMSLISRDIMCRGAISYGRLFHSEDFVFGPALNDAYLTESTAALYPRVILDKSVLDILKGLHNARTTNLLAKMRMETKIKSILNIDTDDKLYIDFFAGALVKIHDETILDYFNSLRRFITSGHNYTSPSIKVKYGWMKNKFNKFIDELPAIVDMYGIHYEHLSRLSKTRKIK